MSILPTSPCRFSVYIGRLFYRHETKETAEVFFYFSTSVLASLSDGALSVAACSGYTT